MATLELGPRLDQVLYRAAQIETIKIRYPVDSGSSRDWKIPSTDLDLEITGLAQGGSRNTSEDLDAFSNT